MAAHRAVAFVVEKKDVRVRVTGGRNHGTVHVGVTARLPHSSPANMIVMLAKIAALLKHRFAFNLRQPGSVDTQRLAARVHFDRRDLLPVRGRSPVELVEILRHIGSGQYETDSRKTKSRF